jgi:hypothetical protein
MLWAAMGQAGRLKSISVPLKNVTALTLAIWSGANGLNLAAAPLEPLNGMLQAKRLLLSALKAEWMVGHPS